MPTSFVSHFVTGTRAAVGSPTDERDVFVKFADDAPQWLKDAVQEAHQGTFPNDWIFTECRAAVEAFDDGQLDHGEDDDDDVHEFADGRVDVYTQELFQWATDFCLTDTWSAAEEEAENMGFSSDADVSKRIAAVQYAALRHIGDVMKMACLKAAEPAAENEAEA